MTHLTISRNHRRVGNWAAKIPVTAIAWRSEVDGVQVVATKRNYWIDTKNGNKLRYETMNADSSSAEYYVDLFVEIKPGIFTGGFIATDSNIDYMTKQIAQRALQNTDEQITGYVNSLIYVN